MLYSEQMKQICEKLGVNPDECKDGLYSTLLQTICDACDGGGGSGGGGGGTGGGDNFPIGDGNTHIWISLAEGRTSPRLGVCVNGTVTVDWGDGSEPDTLTGKSTSTRTYTPNHEYGKAGDYIITLTCDGIFEFFGDSQCSLLTHGNQGLDWAYRLAVKKVEIGNGTTRIGRNVFAKAYNIESIVIPNDVTYFDYFAFSYCYNLKNVTIPDGVTTLCSSTFAECYALLDVFVPSSVTKIEASAFVYCYGVKRYDFSKHTSVPALSNTNAFAGVASDCVFEIPASLYDEWIAATNWSAIAATNTFVGV